MDRAIGRLSGEVKIKKTLPPLLTWSTVHCTTLLYQQIICSLEMTHFLLWSYIFPVITCRMYLPIFFSWHRWRYLSLTQAKSKLYIPSDTNTHINLVLLLHFGFQVSSEKVRKLSILASKSTHFFGKNRQKTFCVHAYKRIFLQ